MATAGDQINAALRLIGNLAEGETASAEASADALLALNQMIDAWSISGLNVYSTQDQQLTWPAIASRTVGPTGQLVAVRPVSVRKAYYIDSGISYHLEVIDQEQYASISQKTSTSTLPEYIFVNMTMPDITVTMYPVPTGSLELHLVSDVALSQPATLATALSFPPGYLRAFKYNLACEIAEEFGVIPSQNVVRKASTSLKAIKRINKKPLTMTLPAGLVRSSHSIFLGD